MGLPGHPKSIRAKLIMVFLLAILPLLFVQTYEHIAGNVQAEAISARHQQEIVKEIASGIASNAEKIKRQHQVYAQKLAIYTGPADAVDEVCGELDALIGPTARTTLVAVPAPQQSPDPGQAGKPRVTGFQMNGDEADFNVVTPVMQLNGQYAELQTRLKAREVLPDVSKSGTQDGISAWIVIDDRGRLVDCVTYRLLSPSKVALHKYTDNKISMQRCPTHSESCEGRITSISGIEWKLVAMRHTSDVSPGLYYRQIWMVMSLTATVVGLLVVFIMGNRLTQPVRRLLLAAQALAVGDYRKRVAVEGGNEFSTLAECFNALGNSLAGREEVICGQAEMLAGMAEAARIASSSLNIEECSSSIARVVCTYLGASNAAVFMLEGDKGEVSLIGHHRKQPDEVSKRLARRSASSGEYLLMFRQREVSTEAGAEHEAAIAGIPLATANGVIGAITAVFGSNIDPDDLKRGSVRADMLIAFGVHAATAIKNAEAYSRTEKYSEVLEDWVGHLSAVMQVTDAISPSLTLDETLAELARTTASVLNADACGIFLPNRRGELVAKSVVVTGNGNEQLVSAMVAKSVTLQAFSEKKYVSCEDTSQHPDPDTQEFYTQIGIRGVLSTPLIVRDRAIGAITIYSKRPRQFDEREIRLLTSIGLHAAVTVRNASLYTRELSIAESLQRNLISEAPDECRGLKFASRYIPALDEARVGGDFYDVTELPNGKVGVVLADVSGKGLGAAIHLAACKYMLKSLMYMHPDNPARVLGELNDAINYYYNLSFFVTVFCGVIDPATGMLRYANAGHPPALLISENGKLHTWLSCTGTPVGSGHTCHYELCDAKIGKSDLVLLYTDGVTDATIGGEMLGVEGLQKMIFEAGVNSASSLVEYIRAQLGSSRNASVRDDIAMLAVSFEEMSTAIGKETGGWSEHTGCISSGTA